MGRGAAKEGLWAGQREPDYTLEGSPWQKEEKGAWKETQVGAVCALVQARKGGPSCRAVAGGLEREPEDPTRRRVSVGLRGLTLHWRGSCRSSWSWGNPSVPWAQRGHGPEEEPMGEKHAQRGDARG